MQVSESEQAVSSTDCLLVRSDMRRDFPFK